MQAVKGLIEYHTALEAVLKPFGGDPFDVPCSSVIKFIARWFHCDQVSDVFGEISPVFATIVIDEVL